MREVELQALEQADTLIREASSKQAQFKQAQYAEARELLERVVSNEVSDIQCLIRIALAVICRCEESREDKNTRALEHLINAIGRASVVEDGQLEVWAIAELAEVKAAQGNTEQAKCYRQVALDKFRALPETNRWTELQKRITDFSGEDAYLLFRNGCQDCTVGGQSGRWSGAENNCKRCEENLRKVKEY